MGRVVHEVPRCAGCGREIDGDPVFAPVCGHADCPSVVWHPVCLMDAWDEPPVPHEADPDQLFEQIKRMLGL